MTTDRTAAPTRSTALAERSPTAGRTQVPPADGFAALLGASTPHDTQAPVRRDAMPRRDDGPRHADRRPAQRDHGPRPANQLKDVAAPDAPKAPVTETDPALADTTAAVSASLFALQLASPLPPAPPAPPVPTEPAEGTTPLPAFAGLVPASVAVATTAQAAVPAVDEAVTAPAAEPAATAAPALPVATTAPATPAAQTATDAATTVPEEAAVPQTPVATPARADAAPVPSGAAAIATGSQPQTSADAQAQDQPGTPAPAVPVAAQATAAADSSSEPAPAQPVGGTAPTNQPTGPVVTGASGLERVVPLSRAVETTALLLHIASERGVTHARLNLKPVELGGIEVRLQTSPQGVSAQLIADSPEAARMLAQAGDDLRRQLEARDVNLLSLDVSTSGDQRRETPAEFGAEGFDDRYRPGGSRASRADSGDAGAVAASAVETTLVLPNGVLVDVLA